MTILYPSRASATYLSFLKMAQSGKRFRVIVVDAKPYWEGRDSLLPQLRAAGISCSYIHINAVGYIMKEVRLLGILNSLGHKDNSRCVLHL